LSAPDGRPRLEHSVDDGRTWKSATAIQPLGNGNPLPSMAGSEGLELALATVATQPNNLCAVVSLATFGSSSGGYLRAAVPPQPSRTLYLGNSADGGTTWHFTHIAQALNGKALLVPTDSGALVSMHDRGDCATKTEANVLATDQHLDTTLWWMPAGSTGQATALLTLTHWTAQQFALVPQDAGLRLYALATPSHPLQINICTSDATCYGSLRAASTAVAHGGLKEMGYFVRFLIRWLFGLLVSKRHRLALVFARR